MKKTGILVLAVLILLIGGLIISCDSSVSEKLLSSNKTLVSISITTPTSLFCWSDEDLDISSIVVKGTYDDGSSANITGWTTSEETNCLTISYTEGGVTKTTTIDVDVQDKGNYMMKGGYGNGDPTKIEWLDGLGLGSVAAALAVTNIEFVSQTPQSFEEGKTLGTDYSTSSDLTSDSNKNIMGYLSTDGTKIWIVGEHFVGNSNCNCMFFYLVSLKEITGLEKFVTSEVTDMSCMFQNCPSLTKLDLSSFDTSAVSHMNYMLGSCTSLTDLNISNFDTSNVTTMEGMFSNCPDLTTLDLSSFDTSSCTTMDYMFLFCSKLTEIDVGSAWTTSGKSTTRMFEGCTSLTQTPTN